jgi:hypothetical protein
MLPNASAWKCKREDLRSKRRLLAGTFENSPGDLTLAVTIKAIDDEIAVCTEHINKESRIG